MTTTRTLISLAIISALPFSANATGPAHDSGNSPVVATASAPYQTVTPDAHADEHIASTAYVIGAYNDAIAAVNKVDKDIADYVSSLGTPQQQVTNQAAAVHMGTVAFDKGNIVTIMSSLNELADEDWEFFEETFVSAAGVVGGIASQRAEVWTTWDNDNAKTQVPFVTASAQ